MMSLRNRPLLWNPFVITVCLLAATSARPEGDDPGARLVEAAETGDIAAVLKLLDSGVDPNAAFEEFGTTPLINACREGHLKVVRLLVERGADVHQRSRGDFAMPPILLAAHHPEVLTFLLEHGADPNAADESGRVPLHRALWMPCVECIRILLAAGADRDIEWDGAPAILIASYSGDDAASIEAVRVLLDAGADVNQPHSWSGTTPLHKAAEDNRPDVVAFLLEMGADPAQKDVDGRIPADIPCARNYTEVLAVLAPDGCR